MDSVALTGTSITLDAKASDAIDHVKTNVKDQEESLFAQRLEGAWSMITCIVVALIVVVVIIIIKNRTDALCRVLH